MSIRNLSALFVHDLNNTYVAEKLVLDALAEPRLAGARADALEHYIGQARNRISHLEEKGVGEDTANDASSLTRRCTEIEELLEVIAGADNADASLSVVSRLQHHFLARYVMLSSWTDLLGTPGPTPELMAMLQEEATILEASVKERSAERGRPATASLGERLTALFERKR